jgi:hypothetical protein
MAKEKYTRAIDGCNKTLAACNHDYECAGTLKCLMEIYRDRIPNDSLYIDAMKKLVRLGYEHPNPYRMVILDLDGVEYPMPDVDLYDLSRNLCCELYERHEFDSALFYFNNYAVRYKEKSWCGAGKEYGWMEDEIMRVRLSIAVSSPDIDLTHLLNFVKGHQEPEADRMIARVALCLYAVMIKRNADYKNGDLSKEMVNNLAYVRQSDEGLVFSTHVLGHKFTLTDPAPKALLTDTLTWLQQALENTTFFRTVHYKEQVESGERITISGNCMELRNGVAIRVPDGLMYIENMDSVPDGITLPNAVVTGTIETTMIDRGTLIWNDNSLLLYPEQGVRRVIINPSVYFTD